MLTEDFDFDLPAAAIAQEAAPRGASRLLVLDEQGERRHRRVGDLPALLRPGDLLVVNDTRVFPARLFALRPAGGRVELLLVEKQGAADWDALIRPGRKALPGTRLQLETPAGEDAPILTKAPKLGVEVLSRGEDGRHRIRFEEPIEPHLPALGHIPLPPYIKRPDTAADRERYQTVFAREEGAIAAPTAGLHFTEEILTELERKGIRRAFVTLHVGIGTFKPVTAKLVHEHRMEAERWQISAATAQAIAATRATGGRIVAVGTTVVRTLETAAQEGQGIVHPGSGRTKLFITPGFPFRAVDVLLTNFHLPKSTLLMLVSAFAGRQRILDAYQEAIDAGYRFYSYGDAMLVARA
jgi:S-adenosylmethionine:tRNA ribosyltransferase-isomerase